MSLVLVSPSTESWSQVRAAAGRSSDQSVSGSAAASVSTIESIVAMFGWIIPTPFAMPLTVTVTGRPSASGSSTVVVASFVTESVVRSAIGGGFEAGIGRLERRHDRARARPRPCRAAAASR